MLALQLYLKNLIQKHVLNEYLDGACKIIFKHAGTVDKFIIDAIMAVFNAPINQVDHIPRAVRCALELDNYCEEFRKSQNSKGIPVGCKGGFILELQQ